MSARLESPDALTVGTRLSVAEYHALLESGQLNSSDRLELLDGRLVPKMTILPPHATAVQKLFKRLLRLVPATHTVRSQQPITLTTSEPEPDLCVCLGDDDTYTTRHPGAAEVGLVVEVADSSLATDRGLKARLYAEAGIEIYWIVNLVDRCIEVHTLPGLQGYAEVTLFDEVQSVPLVVQSVQVAMLPVAEVLP
jgi:Uma2 family endonuclease